MSDGGEKTMDVRVNLKYLIRDRGYIQAALAKRANMTPSKLSQVINLERKLEANEMFALCEAMNITPVELSNYTPIMPEKKEG